MKNKKVIIIGGGAGGFFAAINLKEKNPNYQRFYFRTNQYITQKSKDFGWWTL